VILKEKEVHLVKKVSKELGLTYKELGEKIGYSESNLRKSVHQNRLSPPLKKSIELYLEIINFQKKEEETKKMKNTLREFLIKLNLEKEDKILDK
jgi:ribosome-binding protein aMBF1 (putative translation factor)